jgi:hypothetical protein
LSDKKRFRSIEHLDDDVPGLKAGAIVDADVTAEGLAQIDRTSHANTRIPKSATAALEQDRTPESGFGRGRSEPERLGQDEEARQSERVGWVAEEEAVAEGEVSRDGSGGVRRVEEAVEEFGGGGRVGAGERVLREEDVAWVEAEQRGQVWLE